MRRPLALALALLAALALALPPAPAAAAVVVVEGPVTITLAAPDWDAPMRPGQAAQLAIRVDAPAGTAAAVTTQTVGLLDPAGTCRPVDAPDPEYAGWHICAGRGSWAAALTIPAQDYRDDTACDELLGIPIVVSIAVDGRRIGRRMVTAAYRPCDAVADPTTAPPPADPTPTPAPVHRVALPLVRP